MPAPTTVHIARLTDLVTDEHVDAMCYAITRQVRENFAPAWGLNPVTVQPANLDDLTTNDWILALVDDTGDDGALGYHTEDEGDFVYGLVGVKPVLDNVGHILTGANSVSTVLSHEVLELLGNPHVSSWSDTGRGYLVATEMCDAVQSDYYDLDGVSVSDFLLPDWFSPIVTRGDRFDHCGVLHAPFTVADGGYTLTMRGGRVSQIFGATPPPQWLMTRKNTLRTARTWRLSNSTR